MKNKNNAMEKTTIAENPLTLDDASKYFDNVGIPVANEPFNIDDADKYFAK